MLDTMSFSSVGRTGTSGFTAKSYSLSQVRNTYQYILRKYESIRSCRVKLLLIILYKQRKYNMFWSKLSPREYAGVIKLKIKLTE